MTDSQLPIPFTFSQSSLQDYHDCEKRFFLRYIENLAWPSVESEPILENELRQIEGQKFHQLIHRYLVGIPVEKLDRLADSFPISEWWQNFKDSDINLDGAIIHPEATLASRIGKKHWLTAKYDLIAIHDDKVRLFDWKTYQKRPSESSMQLRYQTRVYRSLFIQSSPTFFGKETFDPEELEMIYWLANFPNQPIILTYSELKFQKDWKHLNIMVDRIENQDEFLMTEDEKKCQFCSYRSYCDRGIIAGEWNEDVEQSLEMPDLSLDQIQEIEF